MDEYDCEHALAISIIRNRVATYVSMDLPHMALDGIQTPNQPVESMLKVYTVTFSSLVISTSKSKLKLLPLNSFGNMQLSLR